MTVKNAILAVFGSFKNTDQNNICASIVFKAKTKEKYEDIFFKVLQKIFWHFPFNVIFLI